MESLRDPAWQGIGAIAGVAALVAALATVLLALRAQRRRSIAYGYTTLPVVSVGDEVQDRVKVLFRDRQVTKVHLQELTVVNTGAQPITPADFEADLIIRVAGGRALSADLVLSHPANLGVRLQPHEDADKYITEVHVPPLLLNPAEGFRVKLLVTGESPTPEVSTRIAGITELGWFDGDTEPRQLRLLRSLGVTFVIFALIAASGWAAVHFGPAWVAAIPAAVGFILIFLFLAFSLLGLGFRITRRFDPYRVFKK